MSSRSNPLEAPLFPEPIKTRHGIIIPIYLNCINSKCADATLACIIEAIYDLDNIHVEIGYTGPCAGACGSARKLGLPADQWVALVTMQNPENKTDNPDPRRYQDTVEAALRRLGDIDGGSGFSWSMRPQGQAHLQSTDSPSRPSTSSSSFSSSSSRTSSTRKTKSPGWRKSLPAKIADGIHAMTNLHDHDMRHIKLQHTTHIAHLDGLMFVLQLNSEKQEADCRAYKVLREYTDLGDERFKDPGYRKLRKRLKRSYDWLSTYGRAS
ncbi:uncharacterized protein BDV17DRAFT_296357 [Aspergillus undulatus]|uniref:uncharacterized protein n=1 Tax=Aspergillus undulatus TaxID=1810928 RepID=UPI003CCD6B7A